MALKLKLLILLLLLNLSGVVWATDYTQDANCVGAWLFTEGAGTTVDDASVNSNTGNFKGAGEPAWDTTDVPFAASGSAPNSVLYDGSNDFIDCGTDSSLNIYSGDMLSVLWIKSTDYNNYRGLISRTASNIPHPYDLYLIISTGKPRFFEGQDDGQRYVDGTSAPATGEWEHIAVTMDVSGSNVIIQHYLNAVANGNGTVLDKRADESGNFYIGNRKDNATPFKGYITEVGVFNDILTSTEINEIMDYGLKPAAGGASILNPIINIF